MGRGAAPAPKEQASAQVFRAQRRAEACRLNVAGWSMERIFREAGLGYTSKSQVGRDVKAALAEAIKEQNLAAEELRAKELMIIESALAEANRIMQKVHVAHGNGRIVRREVEQPDGSVTFEDVIDDGPNLAAADRLIRYSESRRKLLGLDAPAKISAEVDGTINYVINATPEELEQL